MTEATILDHVHRLNSEYAAALDGKRMPDWAACFAEQAGYLCTSRENRDQGLPMAFMMDDSRARINDRIKAVTQVWKGTFEDYHTRHFTQVLDVKEDPAQSVWRVLNNVMVTYTTSRGESRLLVTGCYEDLVVLEQGRARFRQRQAILDTGAIPRYLVYPV